MTTESIFNFVQVTDRIATAGQPTPDQLAAARRDGYEVVINLAPHDADNHALPDEPACAAALGLAYVHIPVAWGGPTAEDYERFDAAMQANAGRQVLLHCAANFRVSAFMSLYGRHRLGWPAQQAQALVDRIWNSRADYRMDDTWARFLADRAQALGLG